jgi:hypothetical protein
MIVSNELGLLHDRQKEDGQIELINVPIILNGKIYPKAVNTSVNFAIKRNPRLVNEVSLNYFPSTGNAQLQIPNKSKSKVVILSDRHLKGSVGTSHNAKQTTPTM